jgi:SAM-dependent methyltransferase
MTVLLLFPLTLFVSAWLLFQVQPMVGKMLLPKLGGSPAVWNSCMVFFQATLLAGYLYAHLTPRWFGLRRQTLIHLGVWAAAALVLPIAIPDEAFQRTGTDRHPVFLILLELTVRVGLPFFALATTAPLVQRWFVETGHPSAKDPYFLYAASNAGSLIALLAYPSLIEPRLPLSQQARTWAWAFLVCAALIALCGTVLWRRRTAVSSAYDEVHLLEATPVTWSRRLRWIAWAFVPSSLLLGVTTYISTDVAPIPLLWVVPLMVYLLSFIWAFTKKSWLPLRALSRLLPFAAIGLILVLLTGGVELRGFPVWVLLAFHVGALFLVGLVCHGALAQDRPTARHLTEFYLWLSLGGVLGGVFNTLLAPVIFRFGGLLEYPLMVIAACAVRPGQNPQTSASTRRSRFPWLDLIGPLLLGGVTWGLLALASWRDMAYGPWRSALTYGLPCVLAYLMVGQPRRFALGLTAVFLVATLDSAGQPLFRERNFFGVIEVREVQDGKFRALYHGTTLHGMMSVDSTDEEGRHEPLTYYHRGSPIGLVCRRWFASKPEGLSVAAVGLGTGSLAYYARPGDTWTFFEIDPTIQRIAQDSRYFSYLQECRTPQLDIRLGDALLQLRQVPAASFDMLILDAFSSDAIPVHLLTREALQQYLSRLKPGGILAIHISNRYLNLRPVVAKLAEDAQLVAYERHDLSGSWDVGTCDSDWVVLARSEADLGPILLVRGVGPTRDTLWELLRAPPDAPLWTNDYSYVLGLFRRRGISDDVSESD